ncbi:hypothetical protein [Rugosimonospora africana]|uniref:Uncharacterized protein n=1 Tax=Rugosimonospora africana TaxID=556532 RepID=A0A8J3R045_9ACTN|nr:hypothetical protein [Rugosimonospora africana]GIH20535.1 hypothetical protein Raf01_87070 [Rugosimonospora africana]
MQEPDEISWVAGPPELRDAVLDLRDEREDLINQGILVRVQVRGDHRHQPVRTVPPRLYAAAGRLLPAV